MFKERKVKVHDKPFVYYIGKNNKGIQKILFLEENGYYPINSYNLDIGGVLDSPVEVEVNNDENSVVLNNSIAILFENDFEMYAFIDELYFAMEELHDVKGEGRATSEQKVIEDLEKYLYGEKDGEFTDNKTKQK